MLYILGQEKTDVKAPLHIFPDTVIGYNAGP